MPGSTKLVDEFHDLRNQYGAAIVSRKQQLIKSIQAKLPTSRKSIESFNDSLLFMMAYPESKVMRELYETTHNDLNNRIAKSESLRYKLYNSGLTGSQICIDLGYEMVKWLRKTYKHKIALHSFAADDGQLTSVLSAVMPQAESEILQDENIGWKEWFKKCRRKGEDLLDALLDVFDQSPIRVEVKDELWNALGIYITIDLPHENLLPETLTDVHYHRTLFKDAVLKETSHDKFVKIRLTRELAEKIIECARVTLIRHLREIDPISFSDPEGISYYQLARGMSIAFYGMRPERRHPIDSYTSYMVFKNGVPFGYGGCWVLFDSGRLALNIFPSFRGGESRHSIEQILKAHQHVYRLNRFTADPYQIGKNNSDGIKSGAFWTYYKLG